MSDRSIIFPLKKVLYPLLLSCCCSCRETGMETKEWVVWQLKTKERLFLPWNLSSSQFLLVLQEPKSPNIMHYKEKEEDMFLVWAFLNIHVPLGKKKIVVVVVVVEEGIGYIMSDTHFFFFLLLFLRRQEASLYTILFNQSLICSHTLFSCLPYHVMSVYFVLLLFPVMFFASSLSSPLVSHLLFYWSPCLCVFLLLLLSSLFVFLLFSFVLSFDNNEILDVVSFKHEVSEKALNEITHEWIDFNLPHLITQ